METFILKGKDFTLVFKDNYGRFSLTGHYEGASGAVGNRIDDPKLGPLNNLHLCDSITGEPMHALTNARYRMDSGNLELAANSLHLTPEDPAFLLWASDPTEKGADLIAQIWKARKDTIEYYIRTYLSEYLPENTPRYEDPETDEGDIKPKYAHWDLDDLERASALANFLDCEINMVSMSYYMLYAQGRGFLVLDEDEAENEYEEYLQSQIENAIAEVPEYVRPYVDEERFKSDLRGDSNRGILSSNDGCENEEDAYTGKRFYIYQM